MISHLPLSAALLANFALLAPIYCEEPVVKLTGVVPTVGSKRLLVTAVGGRKNLAVIEDKGDHAEIVRVESAGRGAVHSAFISSDGERFGAAARDVGVSGQALCVFHAPGEATEIFPAFGDSEAEALEFAQSDDGKTVIVPGTYGVVCWRRNERAEWKEAWACDCWSDFSVMDWPSADELLRAPSYSVALTPGDDCAWVRSFGALAGMRTSGGVGIEALELKSGRAICGFTMGVEDACSGFAVARSPDRRNAVMRINHAAHGFRCQCRLMLERKLHSSWNSTAIPSELVVADKSGSSAAVFYEAGHTRVELHDATGKLDWERTWDKQVAALVFSPDGDALFFSNEAGQIQKLDSDGKTICSSTCAAPANLSAKDGRIFAACGDGFVRAFHAENGRLVWTLDCATAMKDAKPAPEVARTVIQASRKSTATPKIPSGQNLLRSGKASLKLSEKVLIDAALLTNGKYDDVDTPWLKPEDAASGRKIFAEIEFAPPTDVHSLSVIESSKYPESWPVESLVQVWNDDKKLWSTAARGVFLIGPVNTYKLNLKSVTRLRYVPWSGYRRNFYTSEIEVR